MPKDARIILMKIFDNFDIIFVFIVIAISSTIISEEYSKGTIKNLFVKPHKRAKIMCSKIITNIFIAIIIIVFMVLLQYTIGGLIFGFNSYSLDAIIYNKADQSINVMNLAYYMINLTINKKFKGKTTSGEIGLPMENSSLVLPCGIYGRWEN